jgi:hypothetical protein
MVEPGPVRPQDDPKDAMGRDATSAPLPADVLDINVEGRELTAPDDGFGQKWRKRYRVRLPGADVSPERVIRTWRERYGEFWPEGNTFYRPLTGLEPGEVALADIAMPAGTRLSTGVVVIRVEPARFVFMTPQGHTFAGVIAFSAEDDTGTTAAQVEIVMRASDPVYELGMPLGGHAREDRFWIQTLVNLAAHFGVAASPEVTATLIDPRRRWRNAGNVRHNAYLRTGLAMAIRPLRRLIGRPVSRGRNA